MKTRNKTEKLTPAMKIWLLSTLKAGEVSTSSLNEFIDLCQGVQIKFTPEERIQKIEYLKRKLLTD
jgi:hypothetical protein